MSSGFSELSRETLLEGPVVDVVSAAIRTPDGREVQRQIVTHPGAVVVVPMLDARHVLCVVQYRAALGRELLELPAGKLDVAGEFPEAAARRELAEEVGREAGRIEPLVTFANSPGFCDEETHLFLAEDLTEVAIEPDGIEEEFMRLEVVDLAGIDTLLATGRLSDAKTIIGILLVARRNRLV